MNYLQTYDFKSIILQKHNLIIHLNNLDDNSAPIA